MKLRVEKNRMGRTELQHIHGTTAVPIASESNGGTGLWFGDQFMERQEVAEFISYLQRWLDTGRLEKAIAKIEET